jgi:co-chaperonin GroES (HSP10)
MKEYRQLLRELPTKTIVLACGKFNPPSREHELLVKSVKKLAEQKGADHIIYASAACDKRNPLLPSKKFHYLNLVFPNTNFVENADTTHNLVRKLKESYKNIILVTSEEKNNTFRRLGIEVVSACDKDPDADDKLRNYATKGLYEEFKNNLPSSIRDIDSRRLMNDIRIGSGLEPIKEELNLVKDEMREKYFRGEIFSVGEIVESDGKKLEIVKRGSNHLLLKEHSGKLITKWIHNVKPIKESMKTKMTVSDKIKKQSIVEITEEHDDHYNNAQMHKNNAEKAKARNNIGSYHSHMVNHHDELGKWHAAKGRHSSADREYEKAEKHHDEFLKHPYIAEEMEMNGKSGVEHHKDHKIVHHGHDVQIKIEKKHHGKIKALNHGERHTFKDQNDNHWMAVKSGERIHFVPHSVDTQTMSNMSFHIHQNEFSGDNGPESAPPADGHQPYDPFSSVGNLP